MTTTTLDDFVAETLAWCNDRRREKGMEPLAKMPQGERDDPKSCPCGEATGLYVDHRTYGDDWETKERHKLPEAVALFVQEFDAGALPEYDKHAGEDDGDGW